MVQATYWATSERIDMYYRYSDDERRLGMKARDFVLAQINHQETQPVPYTLDFVPAVGERLDMYYGGPKWRERLIPYIFSFIAVDNILWQKLDDARVSDIYGGIWRMDRRPWHHEKGPLDQPSLKGYNYPRPEEIIFPSRKRAIEAEYPPPLTKTEALTTCEQHREESFLVAHVGWGIWETAWQMRGFENAMMDSIAEPDFFASMLDIHTEMALAYVDYAGSLPVDAIMFGEDWGIQTGIMLGPEVWRKFLKPRWAKIFERIHAYGKKSIMHCCGSVADIVPDIIEIGLDVWESVQPEARGNNPYELKKKYGDKITFWGGLSSQSLIPFGKPSEIATEIRKMCDMMGRGGGYILSLAKGLQPETSIENAVAVVEAFTVQQ
jgi:uroporphyrinogen decarboxylase